MEFHEPVLGDRENIERIRALCGHTTSSHCFASIYLWRGQMKLSVAFTENAFLVGSGDSYFFPCGKEAEVREFIEALVSAGKTPVFRYARECDAELCEKYFGGMFTVREAADDSEYIYDRAEQIAMSGKRFTYQRAKVNKARKKGTMTFETMSAAHISDAKEITLEWAERLSSRQTEGGSGSADRDETLDALNNYDALGMTGIMLFDAGNPVGFNIGTFISEDTFDLHISKTLEDDVDTLMKLELYKTLPERIKYINREEDLGIAGLRIHKRDAQPCGFNGMYTLTWNS